MIILSLYKFWEAEKNVFFIVELFSSHQFLECFSAPTVTKNR